MIYEARLDRWGVVVMTEAPEPENPVTVARRMVEAQVPLSRRGPGWDRHWRELEAYAAGEGGWDGAPPPSGFPA